jgi:hypothetical protein
MNMTAKETADTFFRDCIYRFRSHESCMLLPSLDCKKDRFFAGSSSASLTGSFPADKGVITFNQIFKTVYAIAMCHDQADFPQHAVGRYPRDTNMFAQAERRNAALVCSGQVNSPEPFDQGQVCRMENRS